MDKKVSKEIISALGNCSPSQPVLHRIYTDDMPFTCTICKEVMLKKHIPSHSCEVVEKKPETKESSFYDTHCAVVDPETGLSCTRSLNCKSHSVFLKRAIDKRTQPFDLLMRKAIEERKKRKIEKDDDKIDKKEKIVDNCTKLEETLCNKLLSHVPVIEKTFYLPEIKFDTLAIRSLFFQPLKIYRMQQERKIPKK